MTTNRDLAPNQTGRRNHVASFKQAALAALAAFSIGVRAADPADGILIDKVWSGHPVGFALLTDRGHQFIAYYDAERRITVTGRNLGETNWTRVAADGVMLTNRTRMSNVIGWDSHNRLVLALDRDGCLHLSGNMHADPLVYYRTQQPFDLTTLKRVDRMTGEREQRVTCPGFFNSASGDLLFRYRDGGSGNGSDLYNIYDPDARTWRRLFDGPLLEGEGERSAYGTGPRRGPDGLYHMVWMWRDTPDAMSNHSLSYARSRDLLNWETSAGEPIARPITMAKGEVIDAAKPGQGLVNMTYALGWDARQHPVVAYHRYDTNGHSQIFIARADGRGQWETRQLSHWDFRWEFPGQGSQVRQVSVDSPTPDAKGDLLVEYSAKNPGAGRLRIDGETLAVLEQLPVVPGNVPEDSRAPRGGYPGLEVRTETSQFGGCRWLLRWETLGVNRDLVNRDVPPPSEMRLYELPASK
jgi:hypothetical protein